MTTFAIRHGRTSYSARYLVNGDPSVPVLLDHEGLGSIDTLRRHLPVGEIETFVPSGFPRARQTVQLLTGYEPGHGDSRLNELDYGGFEGRPFLEYARWLRANGPWARPAGAPESQREVMMRMLAGLAAQLNTRGPRLIVCHGLLLSLLCWHRDSGDDGEPIPLFFAEAPYLVPLIAADEEITDWTTALLSRLRNESRSWEGERAAAISSEDDSTALALFGPVSAPLEENETDA